MKNSQKIGGIGLLLIIVILWVYKGDSNTGSKVVKFMKEKTEQYAKSDDPEIRVEPGMELKSIFDMASFIKAPVESDNSDVMMPYLGNQTQRAELGRSTWHFLHTMAARYPVDPTKDQMKTVSTFITLFSSLYPCGGCAAHFKLLLKEDPPIVTSRDSLVMWFCRQHNKVNVRLKKPLFDCSSIGDRYPCGCIE